MSEVSRPLQVVLVLLLAFAGLWFVALRPKSGKGGSSASAPAPTHQPAQPRKSSLPGGLGRAVDKANATKRQGDAQAASASRTGAAPQTGANQPAPAATPRSAAPPAASTSQLPTSPGGRAGRAGRSVGAGVTPGSVRRALAHGDAVVLLFWGATSADDRAVRAELSQVDRRGGRVRAWPVSVRGLPRFKNVLKGIEVLQSPSVVVLRRGADPRMLVGYTDHAEIDQATLLALTRS